MVPRSLLVICRTTFPFITLPEHPHYVVTVACVDFTLGYVPVRSSSVYVPTLHFTPFDSTVTLILPRTVTGFAFVTLRSFVFAHDFWFTRLFTDSVITIYRSCDSYTRAAQRSYNSPLHHSYCTATLPVLVHTPGLHTLRTLPRPRLPTYLALHLEGGLSRLTVTRLPTPASRTVTVCMPVVTGWMIYTHTSFSFAVGFTLPLRVRLRYYV